MFGPRVKRSCAAALLAAALHLQGCTPLLNRECSAFFKQDEARRKAQFKTFPIEKQLEIYECGMEFEPPYMDGAYDIAEEGPKNIPFLLEKLKAKGFDEPGKVNVIEIFHAMSVMGKLDCRQDVIQQIEQSMSGMHFKPFRDRAKEMLDDIKKSSCEPTPQ